MGKEKKKKIKLHHTNVSSGGDSLGSTLLSVHKGEERDSENKNQVYRVTDYPLCRRYVTLVTKLWKFLWSLILRGFKNSILSANCSLSFRVIFASSRDVQTQ